MFRTLKAADWFQPDGFPIAVERRDPQGPFGRHRHEFAEIVVITSGRGLHVVGRETWPLVAGDAFVIGGARAHEYRDLKDLRLINVLFQPARLRLELSDLTTLAGYHALFGLDSAWRKHRSFQGRLHLPPRDLDALLVMIDRLDEELRERPPAFAFLATALFMQIIGFLSRCYGRSRNSDSRDQLRIAETIAHLEKHFPTSVNLDDLAAIARMSKRSFMRAFQAATGLPPIAYLIQLRVNRAASLLRSSHESVTDIAFRTGFADSNYFSRQFSKLLGVSPRQYREQHRLSRAASTIPKPGNLPLG